MATLVPNSPPQGAVAVAAAPKAGGNEHEKQMVDPSADKPGNFSGNGADPRPQVSIGKLFSYADGRDKMYMVIGTIAACVHACTMPLFIANFGSTLDELGTPVDPNESQDSILESVSSFCIYFAVIGLVAGVSGFIMVTLWSIAGERQALRMRRAYVQCILKQDIGWFDEHPAGQLPTAVTANMAKVQDGLGRKFGDILLNGISGVALLATGVILDWQLGLVLLACVPFIGGSVAVLSMLMSSSSQEGGSHYTKAGGVANEVLSGIRTVASLNSEEIELGRYRKHLDGAYKAGVKEGMAKGVGNGMLFFSFYMSYGLAFWFGTKQVADGVDNNNTEFTGGDVLSAILAILIASMMFGQTAPGIAALGVARGAAIEVFDVLDRVPPIDSASQEGLKPESVEGEVVFDSVGFSYPARPNDVVYHSLSLDVPVGKTLALVGPSGGGKSTMTKLLLRFYDPTSGTVKLDGRDIKSLNVAWYRQQIGYVGQEPVLFAGTIALNIANGKQGATEDEIIAAARAANAHEFIKSFPKGYNTGVGEGGFQLSGGQKQRIAIARAIIKDPAILLLDEATSALDSESENVVQAALDKLHREKRRTTVTIAHRLSTIQGADKIAVIDKGVVELGTHSELLALDGIYAMLCKSQGSKTEEDIEEENVARQKSMSIDSRVKSTSEATFRPQSSASKQGSEAMDMTVAGKEVAKDEEKLPKPARGRMWGLNKGDWPWLLLGVLGAIIAGGTMPAEGTFVAQVQSNLYRPDTDEMRRVGNLWALGFVGLGLAAFVGNFILSTGFAVAGERMTRTLRIMAFEAMVRHDIAWFDKESSAVGVLTARLEAEASLVRRSTGSSVAHATQMAMTLTIGAVIGLVFAWQIGLLAFATIPLIAAAGVVQMAMVTGGYGDNDGLDGGGGAAGLLSSSLQGMTTVTAFNMQEKLAEDYKNASESSLAARKKRGLIAGAAFG
ncbi:unnamed protein product, partial [Scytosiphon promiscuus]